MGGGAAAAGAGRRRAGRSGAAVAGGSRRSAALAVGAVRGLAVLKGGRLARLPRRLGPAGFSALRCAGPRLAASYLRLVAAWLCGTEKYPGVRDL